MEKQLIVDKLYLIIDQLNERKIKSTKFYSIFLKKMHLFYDGNGRVCQILVANNDVIRQNIRQISTIYLIALFKVQTKYRK